MGDSGGFLFQGVSMRKNIDTQLEALTRLRATGPVEIPCQAGNCVNMIPQDGLVCEVHTMCIPDEVKERLLEACADMLRNVPGSRFRALSARNEALMWARRGVVMVGDYGKVIGIESGRRK